MQAGLTGDRELAFQAFANDPLVSNQSRPRNMFEERYEAQATYLPQF